MIRKGISFLLTALISTTPAMAIMEGDCIAKHEEVVLNYDAPYYGAPYNEYEILNELDRQLQFYEDLVVERKRYEGSIRGKVAGWFSKRPAAIVGAIGSALGVKKGLELVEQNGGFADVANDAEKTFLKGYFGTMLGAALFGVGFVVSAALLERYISNPLSRCKLIRKLFALDPHRATKYLKQRLGNARTNIILLCRQLPLEVIDRKRHYAYSEVKKELLMEVSREILQERQAASL